MDYLLTPTLTRLDKLLIEEVKYLSGIEEQVRILHTKLSVLQDLLKCVDMNTYTEIDQLKSDVAATIDAVHAVEDVTEKYVANRESEAAAGSAGPISILKKFAFNNEDEVTKAKIKAPIDSCSNIVLRLDEANLKASNKTQDESPNSCSSQTGDQPQFNGPPLLKHTLIGLDGTVEELVRCLVNEETDCPQFVVLFGHAGSGKTTTAKKVYRHARTRRHFNRFAWINFSDNIDVTSKSAHQELQDSVRDENKVSLSVKQDAKDKCLVVLDEIWSPGRSAESFNHSYFINLFQNQFTDCKFLLTCSDSRYFDSEEVASMYSSFVVHRTKNLGIADSWKLLHMITSSANACSDFTDGLEKLGRQIAQLSINSPLATMLIGGVLVKKQSSNDWQKVYDNICTLWSPYVHSFLNPALGVSFRDLPTRLKPYLFYLSQFPVGHEIDVSKLIRLWIAEGFISLQVPRRGQKLQMLEELAESNLNELISRCLILVGDRDSSLRAKTCRLHETVRSECLFQEEFCLFQLRNNFSESDYDSSPHFRSRRVAIHLKGDSYQFPSSVDGSHIRSLLLFHDNKYETWRLKDPIFDNLKLLRILDLEGADFGREGLPKSIGELIHLRYLSLRHAKVSKIPSSLGNLRFLQTLDLLIEGEPVYIPNVIWKLSRLRHLYLPEICHVKTKLLLDTFTNLQTLVNFPARNCDLQDIFTMTGLRELTIRDTDSIRNFTRFSKSLGIKLKELRVVCLNESNKTGDKGRNEDVHDVSFDDLSDSILE